MNVNLMMAVFWVILGVPMVIYHWLHPGAAFDNILGTGISAGWLCIVLGLYNVARWWSARSYAAYRQHLEETALRRHRREDATPPGGRELDPNFMFNDPPRTERQRDDGATS